MSVIKLSIYDLTVIYSCLATACAVAFYLLIRMGLVLSSFLASVEHTGFKDKWLIDASVGYAIRHHLFARDAMVSTKTLDNYVRQGILQITPIDLPLTVRRSTRKVRMRKHKKHLGKSID